MSLPGSYSFQSSHLLWLSAIRYTFLHPWQSWLSFVGIMLGVMMVVSVDLANNSARRAFELSVESINGSITHQIVGGSAGVPDSVFTGIRTELGLRQSAPGLSGQLNIRGQRLTLLGLDAISEATLQRQRPGLIDNQDVLNGEFFAAFIDNNAVIMSARTASDLNLRQGDRFQLFVAGTGQEGYLAGIFQSDNPVATEGLLFADIAVAQSFLNRIGRLDSIDLILRDDQVQMLTEWLPPALTLVDTQQRTDSLQQMMKAFHTNLLAMSMLSLLVAALLIYNTVTLSVLQRQKTLGIFRAQGVSRREIFYLVLGESGLLGLLASMAGLLLGLLMGQVLVKLVSRTINDLYFNLHVSSFILEPFSLLKGLVLGLGVTLLSAVLPAWRATHCHPVTLQQRATQDSKWHSRLPWLALTGMVLMLVGFLLLQPEYGSLVSGFMALTLLIFGFCLLVPAFMWASVEGILKLFSRYLGCSAKMALRGIQSGISRTGLAVAALTVAISVTVGVGVMVGSFRATVILWLDQSLAGDIQISIARANENFMAEQLQQQIGALPGVETVSSTLMKQVESEFGQLRISVSSTSVDESFYLKESVADLSDRFESAAGVLISEPLAYLQQLSIGDSISINTDRGMRAFPILGVFFDYTSSTGLVAFHNNLYRNWWDEQTISRLTVFTSAESDIELQEILLEVRSLLNNQDGGYFATLNRGIRQLTLNIFDRTFAITNVLRLLAILVAFVGVLSALMALQLERLREFAILRVSGMTPGQIARLILIQTGSMGLFAGLFALPLGLLMSDVLIDVINRRSFGWSMQHILPENVLYQALILALTAALIAGLYPARRAALITPAKALREE